MDNFSLSLNNSLKKGETVVFSANCSVKYSGRAESLLPKGDRLIIIKSDGTLLVHQPRGSSPINYMKENTSHVLSRKDGELFLKSRNLALKEFLDIKINKVHFINSIAMLDEQKIMLAGTEKDMAEMIFNNPSLILDDFKPLSLEEHTKYGFIDVFGHDKDNTLVVVECKRYTADFKAVSQLRRYVEKIKESKGLSHVRGVLAAPKISPNAEKMLTNFGFEFVSVSPLKYLEKDDKKQRHMKDYF